MIEEFPLSHAILDKWRVHLCDLMNRAYSGFCRHDWSDRWKIENAKKIQTDDYGMCLNKGQDAIEDPSWKELFKNVCGVTKSYLDSGKPSKYNHCKTMGEEIALAAIGFYFMEVKQKL